jgi:hypothetical protein
MSNPSNSLQTNLIVLQIQHIIIIIYWSHTSPTVKLKRKLCMGDLCLISCTHQIVTPML